MADLLNGKKIGIIGVGYWGIKHLEEYQKLGVKVIAIDESLERLQFIKDKFNCEISNNLQEALLDKNLIGVSICTPNESHYDICKLAFYHNKNVLLEKPLTLEYEKAKTLLKIAEEKNLVLAVGHIYRFNNCINYLKNYIMNNELGEIYQIELQWNNFEEVFENRDIIFDLGPHPLDIIDYIFDLEYDTLYSIGEKYRTNYGEELVIINGKSKNIIINIQLSWVTPVKKRELKILTEKKYIIADAASQSIEIIDKLNVINKPMNKPEIIPNNTIQDELRHFIECINIGNITHADGKVGAKIVKILEDLKENLIS